MTQLVRARTLSNGDRVQILQYGRDWFPLTHCLRLFRSFCSREPESGPTQHLVEVQQFFSKQEAVEEFERRLRE